MSRDYRYTIEYQTVSKATGVISTKHTRIISDNPLTIEQIENEAIRVSSEYEYWHGEDAIEWSIAMAEMASNI